MAAPNDIAAKLLDAQVDYLLAEVTGERFTEVVDRDIADVLAVADTIVFRDVVDLERARATVRTVVARAGASPAAADLVGAFADALYDTIAGTADYALGEVVDREPVDAVLAKVLAMHQTQERTMARLTESPLVATVAAKFVDQLIDDVLESNRQMTAKIPGVGSLVSFGTSAAKSARKVAERATEGTIISDMAGKGAMFALKRTNGAIREMLRTAPVHSAAMEFWDLHAGEPVSGLHEYLSRADLRELVELIHHIAVTTSDKEYFGVLLDECVRVFFTRYGDHTLGALLPELGVTPEDIRTEVLRYGPAVIESAKRDGLLANLIRQRLEPFYSSEPVLAILGELAT
ncbi:MAG: hypothetical protein J2P18_17560 [Nocardia sp.]|nr:hypothetical protein [Nocardia sp.]